VCVTDEESSIIFFKNLSNNGSVAMSISMFNFKSFLNLASYNLLTFLAFYTTILNIKMNLTKYIIKNVSLKKLTV